MVTFEASVITIGVIGAIANLLMLVILTKSGVRKREMVIVFNQMTLDFLACLLLAVSFVVKLLGIDYSTGFGRAVCKTLTGEMMVWYIIGCSTANLVVLTLERYVKIVHAVFHKKHFRPWMYCVAIGSTWCVIYVKFLATINATAYAVYKFLMAFVVPLVVFVFCYSRILQVTHKRTFPVNFNNMMKSAAQQSAMKIQMNVIKTFLIISICFVLCWSPNRIYYFLYNLHAIQGFSTDARFATVSIAFLNVSLNPFIYAAKLDPVKKYIRQKFFGRIRQQPSDENVTPTAGVINVIGNPTDVQA